VKSRSSPLLADSGPQRFDAFLEEALYGPNGFYTGGGRAGQTDGDFTTSVENGGLFGSCIARWLDAVWIDLGRPDPFVVIEGGSGPGRLCRDVMLAVEECRPALRYVMVERSTRQRTNAYDLVVGTCFPGHEEAPVAALPDLPAGPFNGVVLANELLDNLPFRLVRRAQTGWEELYVDDESFVGRQAEAPLLAMAHALAGDAPVGALVPLQLKASVWVRRARALLDHGRVLIADYGVARTAELAERPVAEWLRTFRRHRRGSGPLADVGQQDITCEVAFDQLPVPDTMTRQSEWLRQHGLEDLIGAARSQWGRAAPRPTSSDLASRALLDEAANLTRTGGLGDFWVAEWRC